MAIINRAVKQMMVILSSPKIGTMYGSHIISSVTVHLFININLSYLQILAVYSYNTELNKMQLFPMWGIHHEGNTKK